MRILLLGLFLVTLTNGVFATEDSSGDSAKIEKRSAKLAEIRVLGQRSEADRQPSSAHTLEAADLQQARTLSVNEALRRVPGLIVRDEEGFGLRPNIGVRGLNPTRSTKVLLLEDGIPANFAPYGDNASYYHAPIDRYERIEVLKGVGMLRFGPQTIGAVVNYLTPIVSDEWRSSAALSAGNLDYRNLHARASAQGWMLDLYRKSGAGARDNQELEQTDLNLKGNVQLSDNHALTLRLNQLQEDSQVTYSGLTDAEYALFGERYNPFSNDTFDVKHRALSLTHAMDLDMETRLLTSVYGNDLQRDWWRQASTTTDTQCGTSFRDARLRGDAVAVASCNSVQGRLRSYQTYGFEPRLTMKPGILGPEGQLELGVRMHREDQERVQINGTSATARTGTSAENNERSVDARSAFLSASWDLQWLQISPALRYEQIDMDRTNLLNLRTGSEAVNELSPGLGLSMPVAGSLFYLSWHRGFAPPRVEDLIDNNGVSVAVDAERSRNFEIGVRGSGLGFRYDITAFDNDFSNQLAVGSIAGGATPLAQGQTRYRGLEFAGSYEFAETNFGLPFVRAASTWLPKAEQASALIAVANSQIVAGSGAGLRLPYAPEHTHSLQFGLSRSVWDISLEHVFIASQYADFANSIATNGTGQIGKLDSYQLWNLALNFQPEALPFSGFVTVKNLFDHDYIVDRTRGILPGSGRQFVAGVQWNY